MMDSLRALLMVLFFCYTSLLAAQEEVALVPTPPPIEAHAYLLMDFHSDQILMAKNTEERIEPASLTKLMTAYLVFEKLQTGAIKLTDQVRISEQAWRMIGSRMYLEVETEVSVEDLIQGMIIQSGNDASLALAEYVASNETTFVQLMNEKAAELGLTETHYENSTGLPSEAHYSTAYDQILMAQALIRDFPDYYAQWYSQKEYTYNDITQQNRNLLLWRDETVDGIKTGYTEAAGYCLIASAKRGQMRLLSVVLGTDSKKSRAEESAKMLNYGFRFFETYQLYRGNEPLQNATVWRGNYDQVQLGLRGPMYVTIPRGQYSQLSAVLNVQPKIMAPVSAGATKGSLKILLGNDVLHEAPIIALHPVELGNWWQQAVDYLWMQFE